MFLRCGGCGGRNSNFPYRKLFTPDLNVFSLCESYYSIFHILHHLVQKGYTDSCKRGAESQYSVDSLSIHPCCPVQIEPEEQDTTHLSLQTFQKEKRDGLFAVQ